MKEYICLKDNAWVLKGHKVNEDQMKEILLMLEKGARLIQRGQTLIYGGQEQLDDIIGIPKDWFEEVKSNVYE